MRTEIYNTDGTGDKPHNVYDMPIVSTDYWQNVTDVPCPICHGTIRWAENGYVPGYRICDSCSTHFLAKGSLTNPLLVELHGR